ncbi:Translocase of chloroplast 159 chloroplastic [Zea mays]|uniref:Translocase of chloroplast 159 chloroplastic n=1 Tax=Zea mays TaxID=4577 RepID=A0A1D6LIW4_MAIZE|nr:Translocase of chloroplast 159 chloroplastic [Zea mays]
MATTSDAAPVAPVEEESTSPAAAEEEPPKKVEASMATTDVAPVAPAPVEDENLASAAAEESPSKKVEAAAAQEEVEEVVEAPKKVVAGGGEEEEVRLEGIDEGFGGPEAENGQAKGVGGGYDSGDVKEADAEDKGGNLGPTEAEAETDDGGEEPASGDGETPASLAAPMPVVESKSENAELGDGDPSLVFLDALEGDEMGELREEQDEDTGASVEVKVVDKVADDAEPPVTEEEKLEPEVEKGEEVGPRSGDGAQVLYRLSLAEGIRHGRQTNRAFSLDNARRKALLLEAEGKEDLNFSCNILVLGKTGVGKSATINSVFGEEKSKTDAFSSATTNVREIIGDVDGVKIRIIDTPGLRPNVMDQGSNRKILAAVKKYTKKCPPDIVLYVDRLDSLSRDLNDLPLLKTITSVLGSSIWFNAIVALTHAASAPPEGLNGAPMTYEVLMAQRSHIIQQSIRQAAGDMRLMNPVALVENHPSCRKNREGQKVLPNGQSWRHQMLLLCYSSKILSEANSLLKLQDPNPGKLFGFRFRSPPLPFLLSSLLQSRAHPKLSAEQGGNEGDSDIELDDYSDVEQDDEEEEYDQLPPFKPLTKAQLARLTKEQKNAYFDEYDYRVKLLQKKQWKDEIRRLKEMKKRGKTDLDDYGYANITGEDDQDPPPENVSVPLPDMVLPPSFDCDNPTYRYRFLEPTSTVLARPVLDAHGWDHDCGYDGVSVEETLAILSRFPANVAVQVTKDKKEFSIHLDSSIAAKHGENTSSLAGFDIQTVGRQLAYILRGETKIKNIKKNKTTGGFSVTFLGDIVATGLKIEDQLSLGKRLSLVASTGAMRAQGDTAYGANLEARLKDKDYPIAQSLSTLGLSLMKWRRDLALGANLQSQFSIGRGSKMAVRLGLNNKLSGQITVRTSTSEQVQIALLGLVPVAASIYRSFRPSEPSFAY